MKHQKNLIKSLWDGERHTFLRAKTSFNFHLNLSKITQILGYFKVNASVPSTLTLRGSML
jgi:hypothetical protein